MRSRRLSAVVVAALTTLTACGGRVVRGTPVPEPRVGVFCDAVAAAANDIPQSHGDLHVVLRSYERMNAAAPPAIKADTGYVVGALRHAFAVHQVPDLAVLSEHTDAVTRWSAAHCDGP